MNERIKIPQRINDRELIEFIESVETTGPEAETRIGEYVNQCFADAEAEARAKPDSLNASNIARIKAQITIAQTLAGSERYRGETILWLQGAREEAFQDDSTLFLIPHIDYVMERLDLSV